MTVSLASIRSTSSIGGSDLRQESDERSRSPRGMSALLLPMSPSGLAADAP